MHLAIIGNGIAGVTVARYVRKRDPQADITIISDESDHHYSRTALMYIYMGHMTYELTKPYADRFWADNRITLLRDRVEKVNTKGQQLALASGDRLAYDTLVIATGSLPAFYGWPGQHLEGVTGLYNLQDLERVERWTERCSRAVIVGGGLIGVELAEMLRTRHLPVTFLVREPWYMGHVLPKEEGMMIASHMTEDHGVDLRLDTELEGIVDDGCDGLCGVDTADGERIDADFVGIATGVRPNIGFLEGSGIETDKGVLVDPHFRTNVETVYAVGDCAEHREPPPGRKPVEPLWYTGRIQGATAAQNILGQRVPYAPGVFFNSAKFFDLEYQTYGRLDAETRQGDATIAWRDEAGRRALRIQYCEEERSVVGMLGIGVRHRHAVWDGWIAEKAPVETVLQNLGQANFDPEFAPQIEACLVEAYNRRAGASLKLKQRRGWRDWMAKLPMNGTTPHSLKDSLTHVP